MTESNEGRWLTYAEAGELLGDPLPPWHIALALVLGLLCGAAASRIDGSIIAPPYAVTLGTLVLYPLVMILWRRLARLWRRR
jgi:hypothetical protein